MKTQILAATRGLTESMFRELKIYFPFTSFQINKEFKENNIYIRIDYIDGPRKAEVRKRMKPFGSRTYGIAESKSISIDIQRSMSPIVEQSLIDGTKKMLGIKGSLSKEDFLPAFNMKVKDYIMQLFCVMECK